MSQEAVDQALALSDQPCRELLAVYTHALRNEGMTANEQAVAGELGLPATVASEAIRTLKFLHLLREHTGAERLWLVPVDPEVASAALTSPINEEVHHRIAAIGQIRRHLSAFSPHYQQTRQFRTGGSGIEEIYDLDELAGHLHLAARNCAGEFVALSPNRTGPAELRSLLLPGGRSMLDRGVRVRLLLQHAARTDVRARGQLDNLVRGGAEIRTTGEVPRPLMLFDSGVAFLLNHAGQAARSEDGTVVPEDGAAGAEGGVTGRDIGGAAAGDGRDDGQRPAGPIGVIIRSSSAVQLLLNLVETTWSGGQPYAAKERDYQEITDHLRGAIIALLADGLTDDAIARRLGVSVRTCRRHIASVLRDLDAVSRFQAGVRVGASARRTRSVS